MRIIAILLALWPATVYADSLVGQIVRFGGLAPAGWVKADGRCLEDSKFPELASVLHDGDNWPYGRCDEGHFRIPDLTDRDKRTHYILRSK